MMTLLQEISLLESTCPIKVLEFQSLLRILFRVEVLSVKDWLI